MNFKLVADLKNQSRVTCNGYNSSFAALAETNNVVNKVLPPPQLHSFQSNLREKTRAVCNQIHDSVNCSVFQPFLVHSTLGNYKNGGTLT